MNRSHQDWLALKKAEHDGREAPGTHDRLWREHEEAEAAEKKRRMDKQLAEAKRLHDQAMQTEKKAAKKK